MNTFEAEDAYSQDNLFVEIKTDIDEFLHVLSSNQNLAELNRCKGYVRSSLAKKIDLRKVPELTFLLDDTFYKDERINAALKREEEQIEKAHKESK